MKFIFNDFYLFLKENNTYKVGQEKEIIYVEFFNNTKLKIALAMFILKLVKKRR